MKARLRIHRGNARIKSQSPGAKGQPAKQSAGSGSAFIALGANLGDPERTILNAIEKLQSFSGRPLVTSSLWRTAPVDCPPGSPAFLNAVIRLVPRPGETPDSLLLKLQALERAFGRKPKKMTNEPRPLDLDLITFAGHRRRARNLVLPHPRAHRRRFVLQPLSEIAPGLVLPGQTETVAQLLRSLPPDPTMRKLKRRTSRLALCP